MIEILNKFDDTQLPVFAKKAFLESRSERYGWICSKKFTLPFIIDKRYIFSRLIFTTEIVSKDMKPTNQEEREFLNKTLKLIKRELNVDMVAKAQSNAVFKVVPDGSISVPWGTYTKDIQLSDEELMNSIKSKTRNMVRKAIKGDVKVVEASYEELWRIMKDTFERQGENLLAPSLDYIKNLKTRLKDNLLILKAVQNGKIQGVVGIPYDKDTGYYLFGGSTPKPYTGSLNFLHFEAMRILRDRGVEMYDFVGARINPPENSKYHNIQRFKTSFAPELKQGYAFKVVHRPFKYMLMNYGLRLSYLLKGRRYHGDPIDQILRQHK
ncbi:GNAT family N-acetyltransferase [Muricauda sp. NFXS6]|uniref:lipid II:glycine glycyltransferase FemX n=1 Tax=Allomuricauda sp. NFXS6 TaxID=2819094 RepID=UPI0032DECA4A